MIHLKKITYRYPHTELPALSDISLDIPAGEFCAVVGPNMAGKSTLSYALTGFVPHFFKGELQGGIEVAGYDVAKTPLEDIATVASLVFANPFNQITGARYTVREEIGFGLENLGIPRAEMIARIDAVMALTGLTALAERSPYALSGGQQQRLALAAVLAMRPKVLVLDEPTSQLDPLGKKELFNVLYQLASANETTVVLISHELEWIAAYADRAILMDAGKIIADGPPQTLLAQAVMATSGVGQTRYTQAAQRLQERGLADVERPLPVTLDQAARFFQS